MVSLNYKNNVIKNILKEDFDPKQFNYQIKSLAKILAKIVSDGVNNNAYILEEDGYTSIIVPTGNIVTKDITDLTNHYVNTIRSKFKDIYGNTNYKKSDNYWNYIPCKKLFYKIDNKLDFDIMSVAVQFFSREKGKDISLIMSQEFNNNIKLGEELYKFVGNQLKQYIEKSKKLIKNDKNFSTDLTNVNLDDVSKELEVIEKIDDQEEPKENKEEKEKELEKNDFLSNSKGKTLMLDPQHLIRTEKYMNVMTIEQTAQENLLKIKEFEKDNPINYLAANIIFNTIENVAKANASEKVNIFDDEVKTDLSKIKNHSKKSVSSIETLDKLKNNTVGYSMIKNISTKPVEILSPMVLANMDNAIKWGRDGDMTSKQIIEKIFGSENMKNAKISYPLASTKFFDSYMAIPYNNAYRIMKVSTTGGIDGAGASASLESIYEMLVNHEGKLYNNSDKIIKLVQSMSINEGTADKFLKSIGYELTPNAIALSKNYITEIIFLIIFGGTSTANHQTIFNALKTNKFFGIDYSHCNTISEYIKTSTNALNITDCVIKLLNLQKYDIAQINCTPRIEKDKFWYDYEIQYPAHFSGTVNLENSRKGVTFHIMAAKS